MGPTFTELTNFSNVQLLTKHLLCYTQNSMVLYTSFTEVPLCSALNKAFALSHSQGGQMAGKSVIYTRLHRKRCHLQWVPLSPSLQTLALFSSVTLLTVWFSVHPLQRFKAFALSHSQGRQMSGKSVIYSRLHCKRCHLQWVPLLPSLQTLSLFSS